MGATQGRSASRARFHVVRWSVLLTVLAVSTVIGLLHQKAPELRLVGVDALCPFGGVESLWALLASGEMFKRVAVGSFVLLGLAVGVNVVFGRAFCGQFCPLGTLQEIFGVLRDKLGFVRREIPRAVDVPARFIKYLVFGVFTWLAWFTGSLMIRPYDPWVAYHHLTSAELFTSVGVGTLVLAVSLAGSFIYDRFFCKYLCPMGAFLGLFNKVGIFRVVRHADACVDCGACDKACPVNIEVSTADAVVDSECISCAECVAVCPKADALRFENRSGASLAPARLAGVTAGIIVGVVAFSVAVGAMEIVKPALAVQAGVAPAATAGEAGATPSTAPVSAGGTGTFDVALIKGYMTMAEVSQATGIPAQEFVAQFGVTSAELAQPIKEVKNGYSWDTQAVRDWVADRTGSPRAQGEGGCE